MVPATIFHGIPVASQSVHLNKNLAMQTEEIRKLITEHPMSHSWTYEDGSIGGLYENPKFAFCDNTSNETKVIACIIAYNDIDILPNYKTLERVLGLTRK